MNITAHLTPAEEASRTAFNSIIECLEEGRSFLLEAGAGAGKTYALVATLRHLLRNGSRRLAKLHQCIACITYTNVAKDEIIARTDNSPLIYCDTIHGFSWSLIRPFQKQLRQFLPALEKWKDSFEQHEGLTDYIVEYDNFGFRSISDDGTKLTIHHDDVVHLMTMFLENDRFCRLVADRYPVILIDEYQDTNASLMESIKSCLLSRPGPPLLGLFGDHWQMIYRNVCGKVTHERLTPIDQKANFRSVSTIVQCLNRMRPELPQEVLDPQSTGTVHVFHTDLWPGPRLTGGHWQGDLPEDQAQLALQQVTTRLAGDGWEFSPDTTKVLMLTHRALASHQGYGSLPAVFDGYNDAFIKKEQPHIEFLVDRLEPACSAFSEKKYGAMFEAFGSPGFWIKNPEEKQQWIITMNEILDFRANATVGEVIDYLKDSPLPILPGRVRRLEVQLEALDPEAAEIPRQLTALRALREVQYQEIVKLKRYLDGHSPFETKHGVKGVEFENVLIVVGRGWNLYNFVEMLERAKDTASVPANKKDKFVRNRNLFYVTCSRAIKRLALLFTQELSEDAMQTLEEWFGEGTIQGLEMQA